MLVFFSPNSCLRLEALALYLPWLVSLFYYFCYKLSVMAPCSVLYHGVTPCLWARHQIVIYNDAIHRYFALFLTDIVIPTCIVCNNYLKVVILWFILPFCSWNFGEEPCKFSSILINTNSSYTIRWQNHCGKETLVLITFSMSVDPTSRAK